MLCFATFPLFRGEPCENLESLQPTERVSKLVGAARVLPTLLLEV